MQCSVLVITKYVRISTYYVLGVVEHPSHEVSRRACEHPKSKTEAINFFARAPRFFPLRRCLFVIGRWRAAERARRQRGATSCFLCILCAVLGVFPSHPGRTRRLVVAL